jgi:hypothetical protein
MKVEGGDKGAEVTFPLLSSWATLYRNSVSLGLKSVVIRKVTKEWNSD